jgi:hypothetical protein
VYDNRTQVFYLRDAEGNFSSRYVPAAGVPVTGDWDGDGRWDLGHYDPATATFALRTPDGSTTSTRYGAPGSLPVVGFWNGDQISDLGVWDPSTAEFSLRVRPRKTETVRFGKIR